MFDERRHPAQQVGLFVAEQGSERLQREATHEDRDLREEQAGSLVEEVVTPVEGRAKRLLALGQIPRPFDEEVERTAEQLLDLGGSQQPHASGGQLDGEWQAVNPAADLGDGGGIRLG